MSVACHSQSAIFHPLPLCVSMTQRAVPAGTLVPGRANHAGLVEG